MASAIPAGGHTGDALACRDASVRPSLPAIKYMTVKMPMSGSKEKRRDRIANSLLRVGYFYADVNLRSILLVHAQESLKPPNNRQLDETEALVEILVRIAHPGVFRFVTDLRRKFRIAGMNVRDIRRQNWIIAVMPNWKRKRQNLNKTCYVSRARAPKPAPNAITGPCGIAFRLVDLVNRHKKLSRSDEKIRHTATEFARWPEVIPRGILNIGQGYAGKASHHCRGEDYFHRHSKPVK